MGEHDTCSVVQKCFLKESRHTFSWGQIFQGYRSYPPVQLLRVLRGEADWIINKTRYSIREGDMLLLSAVDYRQFLPLAEGITLDLSALCIHAPRSYAEDMTVFYLRPSGFSNLLPRNNAHTVAITDLHSQIVNCLHNPVSPLDGDFMDAALSLICVHLKYIYPLHQISGGSRQDQLLRDAYHYIAEHCEENLSTAEIAKALFCTPEHLSRTFHRLSGIRLSDYIRRMRIRRVLRMLESENMTVLEAAFSSGFNSASGFYKAFHAETGVSPREYFRKESPADI